MDHAREQSAEYIQSVQTHDSCCITFREKPEDTLHDVRSMCRIVVRILMVSLIDIAHESFVAFLVGNVQVEQLIALDYEREHDRQHFPVPRLVEFKHGHCPLANEGSHVLSHLVLLR